MSIVFRISGDILHTPSKLCLQSTGNKYHNILDAYAGYKKLRVILEKKSRQAHYFLYKEKKKKITIFDAYCVQNFGGLITYTLKIMLPKHR